MKKGFDKFQGKNVASQEHTCQQQEQQPSVSQDLAFVLRELNSSENHNIINSLVNLVEQQARMLQKLLARVQTMNQKSQKLSDIIKVMCDQKNSTSATLKSETNCMDQSVNIAHYLQAKKEGKKHRNEQNINEEVINSLSLIHILFGSDQSYDYKLQLVEELQQPIYRERNFTVSIELVSNNGDKINNCNKIPLSLALYTSQNPPKFIEKNISGQKILKGYIEQNLQGGVCRFEKLQIREVTSHFRNGWVFIVVIPCMTPLGTHLNSSNYIDYTHIEPLVLDKIIVKAKKIKEKLKRDPTKFTNDKKHSQGPNQDLSSNKQDLDNVPNLSEDLESNYIP